MKDKAIWLKFAASALEGVTIASNICAGDHGAVYISWRAAAIADEMTKRYEERL